MLDGPSEVKCMFLKDIIEEVDKFKVVTLRDRLTALLRGFDESVSEVEGRCSR